MIGLRLYCFRFYSNSVVMKYLFLILILYSLSTEECKCEKYDILIRNVNIIDVEKACVIQNQDVGIRHQLIKAIANGNQLLAGDSTQIINGKDKYLIPGLWDMHVHFYFPDKQYLKMYLAKGVVGVREMTGYHLDWKDSTNRDVDVPRIEFSSQIIDGPRPWFEDDIPVLDCEKALEIVQQSRNKGSKFIKLLSLVPRDQYMAIVDECKRLDFEFAGHVPYSMGLIEAAKLGQKSNEHLCGLLLSCSKKEKYLHNRLDSLFQVLAESEKISKLMKMKISGCTMKAFWSFDQQKADSVIEELSQYNMYQCPTLGIKHRFYYDELDWVFTDKRYDYFPPSIKKRYRPTASTLEKIMPMRRELKLEEKLLLQMHKKGIKIIAGTDQGCAGFNLHDELEYFVKLGLTNADALKIASINAAKFMNKENIMGSIEINKLADLVLLNANPLENIQNTRNIELLIFKNQIIYPDKLLREVKALNVRISSRLMNAL